MDEKIEKKPVTIKSLEDEIRRLSQSSAERRCMALGSFYKGLQLTDEQAVEVQSDLRRARMYEVLTVNKYLKRAELAELRQAVMEGEEAEQQLRQRFFVGCQLLKKQALELLQRESEASQAEEDLRLSEDRRLILQREKEKILERRRAFEAQSGAAPQDAASLTSMGVAPVLVMNVALGNGKEDKIMVAQYDDPKLVAGLFAKKHNLGESAVGALTAQIKANLVKAKSSQPTNQHYHTDASPSTNSSTGNNPLGTPRSAMRKSFQRPGR